MTEPPDITSHADPVATTFGTWVLRATHIAILLASISVSYPIGVATTAPAETFAGSACY